MKSTDLSKSQAADHSREIDGPNSSICVQRSQLFSLKPSLKENLC